MKYRGYKIDLVVVLALLTLLILIGGHVAYERIFIEHPLLNQLQSIPGVVTASVEKATDSYNITLDSTVNNNLPTIYRQAAEVAQHILGSNHFALRIIDNRTTALENIYWQIQIYIEEAVAQGNFSVAAEKISELAKQAGVQANFYVDEERVYLELLQNEAYLYAVRPRTIPQKGVADL
ncbi:MAG: hypothetical protein GX489_07000 [Firmicutes bacterium]|nr:hypothetical protein [Bacillota bacterium]